MKIRNLINYSWTSIPGPSDEEKLKDILEWDLRFSIANFLGISDEEIERRAKKEYRESVISHTGLGYGGSETWEKDCENWRKHCFVDRELPSISVLKYVNKNMMPSKDVELRATIKK
jgi:hypothetical protein